jgi:hypothetical protein
MTTPQVDKVKPRTRAELDAELYALSDEAGELERTIAAADEAILDTIHQQQLAAHDPGEPDGAK